jgi:signal transduction histidine kinase
VLAYSENVEVFESKTKKEVLNRLNLMSLNKNGAIFTLDNNLDFIQNSYFPDLIGKNFNLIQKDKETVSSLFDYSKMAKMDLLANGEYKYFWKELNTDSYSLLVFKYIEDWDWLIGINLNINNINNAIVNVIGVNESKINDLIYNSILAGLLFILIASFISYFI